MLVVAEQVVAPFDRRTERLLAGPHDAGAADEETEAVVELHCDLLGAEVTQSGGGELDRERDAVEVLADLRHGGGVGVGDAKRWTGATATVDEERDSVEL